MIKKSKNITFMFASFNAISIVTHLSINILLVLKHLSFSIVYIKFIRKFIFLIPFKTQDLEKTRLSIMWKTKQT